MVASGNESSLIPVFSDAGDGAVSSQNLHKYSDVDIGVEAQHHTLGTGPTQAAAGSHRHSNYAEVTHEHATEDLPPVEIPDEVLVSDVDPTIDNPELPVGTIWLNPTEIDADIEVVQAYYDDTNEALVDWDTGYAHPSNWGRLAYTPPRDGVVIITGSVRVDTGNITGGVETNQLSKVIFVLVDNAGGYVGAVRDAAMNSGAKGLDEHRTGTSIAFVTGGETYYVECRANMLDAAHGDFSMTDFDFSLIYFPSGQYTTVALETTV